MVEVLYALNNNTSTDFSLSFEHENRSGGDSGDSGGSSLFFVGMLCFMILKYTKSN